MPAISHDPARGFDGRWLVAATLSLFLVVPVFVWILFGLVRPGGIAPVPEPLAYAEREEWPAFGVTPESLERGPMSRARTNEKYEDLPFEVTGEREAAVSDAAAMAERDDFFENENLDAELEALVPGAGFYAEALLALRAEHRGERAAADRLWQRAFASAPAALHQRVVGPGGERLAGAEVGTVALAFVRTTEADSLDPSLRLVYPGVTADENGLWSLPIFKSVFRVVDPPGAAAGTATLGGYPPEVMLTFPGRVADLGVLKLR